MVHRSATGFHSVTLSQKLQTNLFSVSFLVFHLQKHQISFWCHFLKVKIRVTIYKNAVIWNSSPLSSPLPLICMLARSFAFLSSTVIPALLDFTVRILNSPKCQLWSIMTAGHKRKKKKKTHKNKQQSVCKNLFKQCCKQTKMSLLFANTFL